MHKHILFYYYYLSVVRSTLVPLVKQVFFHFICGLASLMVTTNIITIISITSLHFYISFFSFGITLRLCCVSFGKCILYERLLNLDKFLSDAKIFKRAHVVSPRFLTSLPIQFCGMYLSIIAWIYWRIPAIKWDLARRLIHSNSSFLQPSMRLVAEDSMQKKNHREMSAQSFLREIGQLLTVVRSSR